MASPPRPTFAALSLATSANGTARVGATLLTDITAPGSMLVRCHSEITTASVAATFKIQVSTDATTWVDLKTVNNAANVATAAGTGSNVETDFFLEVPFAAYAAKYIRVVATLAGAATAAADKTSASYVYVPQGKLSALM